MKNILILAVLAMCLGTSAMAGPKWSIVGVGDMAKFKLTDGLINGVEATSDVKAKLAIGGGLLAEFPLSPRVGFETGVLYLTKKYDSTTTIAGVALPMTTDKYSALQIPAVFKFWLNHMIAIGVGGYYASGVGQVESTAADGTVEKNSFQYNLMKKADYGLLGNLNIAIPMGSSASFLLGGQYQMGMANMFDATAFTDQGLTASGTVKTTDIQAFAGIRFGGNK